MRPRGYSIGELGKPGGSRSPPLDRRFRSRQCSGAPRDHARASRLRCVPPRNRSKATRRLAAPPWKRRARPGFRSPTPPPFIEASVEAARSIVGPLAWSNRLRDRAVALLGQSAAHVKRSATTRGAPRYPGCPPREFTSARIQRLGNPFHRCRAPGGRTCAPKDRACASLKRRSAPRGFITAPRAFTTAPSRIAPRTSHACSRPLHAMAHRMRMPAPSSRRSGNALELFLRSAERRPITARPGSEGGVIWIGKSGGSWRWPRAFGPSAARIHRPTRATRWCSTGWTAPSAGWRISPSSSRGASCRSTRPRCGGRTFAAACRAGCSAIWSR